jgi:hypothetical protein
MIRQQRRATKDFSRFFVVASTHWGSQALRQVKYRVLCALQPLLECGKSQLLCTQQLTASLAKTCGVFFRSIARFQAP